MGKLDVSKLQYMTKKDFKILHAIEIGMKNHEIVPGPMVAQLAKFRSGGVFRKLQNEICQYRLAAYERGKHYDGYRLTNLGYDFLALNMLSNQKHVVGVGSQFGVGKESDIYVVIGQEEKWLCMKLHRLGRTSFRNIKEKRDYHKGRELSWIYLSRLSATKEFAYMKALHDNGFPVPEPVAFNRHCVIMELIKGHQLQKFHEEDLNNIDELFNSLMNLIIKFANYGVIHSDFNEFNIMIDENEKPIILDFPQMVSTSHTNAKMYFDRDVECVKSFFKKRFKFESDVCPNFETDVGKVFDLDKVVAASGYKDETKKFNSFLDGKQEEEEEEQSDEEKDISDNDNESDNDNDVSDVVDKSDKDESEGSNEEDDASESNRITNIINPPLIENPLASSTLQMYFQSIKTAGGDEGLHTICENKELSDVALEMPEVTAVIKDIDTESVSSRRSRGSSSGQPASERSLALRQHILKAKEVRSEAMRNGEYVSLLEVMEESKHEDDRLSCVSFSTTASTVDPQTLKKRTCKETAKEKKKQVSKKNLRVKGEANAFTRKKRENMNNIKQNMECMDLFR